MIEQFITFWIGKYHIRLSIYPAPRYHRSYSCVQTNPTFYQRMQIFWLNGVIVPYDWGECEITFLTEDALDHYLFLNPYLWDEHQNIARIPW